MAYAGKIGGDWLGLNCTAEEAGALVAWWKTVNQDVDFESLSKKDQDSYNLAAGVISALEVGA